MTGRSVLAFQERHYTLADLDALAAGLAAELHEQGVRAGDRVAVMSSNRPEFVVALRALWRLGASAVLLSPAWKQGEVRHALALTSPVLAVGDHPVLAEVMPMRHLDEPIDAAEALRIGLVNRVVPEAELDAAVGALATRIAGKARRVLAIGKEAFGRQLEMGLEDAYGYAAEVMTRNMMMADAQEGIDAFLGKRPPRWEP